MLLLGSDGLPHANDRRHLHELLLTNVGCFFDRGQYFPRRIFLVSVDRHSDADVQLATSVHRHRFEFVSVRVVRRSPLAVDLKKGLVF